jgi:hypothetical protein
MHIEISPPRSSGGIEIKQGRPDVQARILEFVEGTNGGKTAVYVCGPAGMADAARMAVGRGEGMWNFLRRLLVVRCGVRRMGAERLGLRL